MSCYYAYSYMSCLMYMFIHVVLNMHTHTCPANVHTHTCTNANAYSCIFILIPCIHAYSCIFISSIVAVIYQHGETCIYQHSVVYARQCQHQHGETHRIRKTTTMRAATPQKKSTAGGLLRKAARQVGAASTPTAADCMAQ